MLTKTTNKNQTIIDLAVQHYGNAEAVVEILANNKGLLTDYQAYVENNKEYESRVINLGLPFLEGQSILIDTNSPYYNKKTVNNLAGSHLCSFDINNFYMPRLVVPIGSVNLDVQSIVDCIGIGAIVSIISNVANSSVVAGLLGLVYTKLKYGYLYNWYAASDSKNIASSGWHVPTSTELTTLRTYLGGSTVASRALKEIGTFYWDSLNTNATNSSNFNGRGAGIRSYNGLYYVFLNQMWMWASNQYDAASGNGMAIFSDPSVSTLIGPDTKTKGFSLRLLKDSTGLSNGQTGSYTGNDGKIYRTICIGSQEWVADNLAETLYRDGSSIPTVTNTTTWAGLTTGARCAFNNDESNVLM